MRFEADAIGRVEGARERAADDYWGGAESCIVLDERLRAAPGAWYRLPHERGRPPVHRLIVTIVLGIFLAAPASAEAEAPIITPSELQERIDSGDAPVIIDVRSEDEFKSGHIPGALHIPYDQVAARISQVDAPDGVALYCLKGPRARMGEAALLESGYTKVLHIEGGFTAWHAAGLPVETSP